MYVTLPCGAADGTVSLFVVVGALVGVVAFCVVVAGVGVVEFVVVFGCVVAFVVGVEAGGAAGGGATGGAVNVIVCDTVPTSASAPASVKSPDCGLSIDTTVVPLDTFGRNDIFAMSAAPVGYGCAVE